MQNQTIPHRMYTDEVLKLARFNRSRLIHKRRKGEFPQPIDRGRQDIYLGRDVYKALGLTDDIQSKFNPWD